MKQLLMQTGVEKAWQMINVADELAEQLETLDTPVKGSFAFVKGHKSGIDSKDCLAPTVSDILFISSPSYPAWLARRQARITALDVLTVIGEMHPARFDEMKGKIKTGTVEDLFNEVKAARLETIGKSLSGDTSSDGYRLGHAECYAHFKGWKIHLVTEKQDDGLTRPVLAENRLFTAKSLILPMYEYKRTVTTKGLWKQVNSRPATIMGEALDKACKLPDWKCFSLQQGNFDYITMQKTRIIGAMADVTTSPDAEADAEAITGFAAPMANLLAGIPATANA